MGRKKVAGLINRKGIWHIDKVIRGRRICESTGESEIEKAEKYLIFILEKIREAEVYGVRPARTWRQAATKYLNEAEKSSLRCDSIHLSLLDPFIGHLSLKSIHMGTLQSFIDYRRSQGRKKRTINYALQVVRHILNLAAGEWLDENGLTWLSSAPKIKLFREDDKRAPYPISWEEQVKLFDSLPEYLRNMALFSVNTGCREQEVCELRWDWEIAVKELQTSVFIIPDIKVKNSQDRLVVLNRVAREVIEKMRGRHHEYVFSYKGRNVANLNNRAWKKARVLVNLNQVRVHDLKHTFGRRLRAAGVSLEDREDLLGHKSVRITTHYSAAELTNLIIAAEKACVDPSRKSPALVILRQQSHFNKYTQHPDITCSLEPRMGVEPTA